MLKNVENKPFIAVELDSPVDPVNVVAFMKRAQTLIDAGADALTIADCPLGKPRVDAALLAAKVRREKGFSVIPHMTCRDRNALNIHATLLGLKAEGIADVLAVRGDPIASPEIKSVFNFNSCELIKFINSLNLGFNISAALNVNAPNFNAEMSRTALKEEMGVKNFFTQPVFSSASINNLKSLKSTIKSRLYAGILPIVSYKNACFLDENVAGIDIPDDIKSLYFDATYERSAELAVEISLETAKKARPFCDGYYIMTVLNRADISAEIVRRIREENL